MRQMPRGRSTFLFFRMALFLALILPWHTSPEAMAIASGVDEGYSAKVLEKILKAFSPAAELGNGKISLQISVDGDGALSNCRVRQTSGNASIDKAFCAAIKKASPFGQPPYGQPAEVSLTFMEDKGLVQKPSPVAETSAHAGGKSARIHPADEKQGKYLSKVTREIRESVFIPAESKKGSYTPTAHVKVAKNGKILDYSIVKSSGDKIMDKYLLQGIKRKGAISAPPDGMPLEFDLTFHLVR